MFASAFYTDQQVITLYGIVTFLTVGPLAVGAAALAGYLFRKSATAR